MTDGKELSTLQFSVGKLSKVHSKFHWPFFEKKHTRVKLILFINYLRVMDMK